MSTFQKLKHEARRAEQRSDWALAIDLYQRALETDEDMADLSLYNRIGDLYLRLGQNDSAVESYERAIERYADNGMHTSAIALCNKILRIAPGRFSVYRRLGLLHARTGLVVEGRAACLTYVRASLDAGAARDAAAAVAEFVEMSGDEQIRLGYAEALAKHDDPSAAAEQLRTVIRERTGRGMDTAELAARLEKLVPGSEAAIAAEPGAEAPLPESPGEARLARLVAARLQEAGGAGAFDSERPAASEDASPESSDALEGLRRELARFRHGVEDVLAANDLTLRYDLGVELMVIGFLDEAIEEFQVAVSEPALVEAANARIGECLARRTSGLSFDMAGRPGPRPDGTARPTAGPLHGAPSERAAAPEAEAAIPEPEASIPEPEAAVPEPEAATPEPEVAVPEWEPDFEAGKGSESEAAGQPELGTEEDELQGHFFRARLAQYRIRRAEERHTVDHAAHLDLGAAYVQMDLHQEALRELCVAFGGPRPISGRAARALKRLALLPDVAPELAIEVLERLAAADSGASADTLGAELAGSWGERHPMAPRLAEVRGRLSEALHALPALEDMFPALDDDSATGGEGDDHETMADGDADPAPESGGSPDATVTESEFPSAPAPAPASEPASASEPVPAPASEPESRSVDSVGERLARAAELVDAGAEEEATDLLDRSLRELEEAKRTRDALAVLDRLLELHPDEVGRHERRTELTRMVDDRDLQLAAYAALAECLRRSGDPRGARVAYGRMLDLDDENGQARQAIARIDADELEVERLGEQRRRGNGGPPAAGSEEDAAEVEALLGGLGAVDEDVEAVAVGEDAETAEGAPEDDATARSQFELGLAFRQMGMWEEASRELRSALHGVAERLTVLEALGECLLKAGRSEEAVKLLEANLRADEDEEQVGPLYFLGLALQSGDEAERAREVFARIETARPGYRDTAERLSELSL